MSKRVKEIARIQNVPEECICPLCYSIMEAEWENNGFTEPEGPSKWEITSLNCPTCGYKN